MPPHGTDEKYGEIQSGGAKRCGKKEQNLVPFSKKSAALENLDDYVDTNKDWEGTTIYTFQPMRAQYGLKQLKPFFEEECPKL
jgi:hypothetical protein